MFRQPFLALLAAVVSTIPQRAEAWSIDDDSAVGSPVAALPTWEPKRITVDAQTSSLAQEWLARIADGRIDRAQLDPQLSGIMTDAVVSGGTKYVGPYGQPKELVPIEIRTNCEGVATLYRVRYSATALTWIVRTNCVGRINGMCLRRSAHNAIYRVGYENRMGTL